MTKHKRLAALVGLLALAVVATIAMAARGPNDSAEAQNPDAEVEAKIDGWLGKMTFEQKLGQLQQLDADFPSGKLTDEQLQMVRDGTLGSTLNARGAANTNAAQKVALEESDLKIPLLFGFDVIHGYRTVFPVPLATASSWDPAAAKSSASVAAREARAAGVHWTFAPMVDIARDARWGRIVEGAGEDPFLGSAFARAQVEGFQGDDYSQPDKVAATAKHFAAYGGAEAGRDYNTVDVSERRLRELYFPPFKAAVDAGVDTFMTSFNDVAGVPATANHFLLTDVLRKEWGVDGPVISDYTAVQELINHGVAADGADAARQALNAGTDIEMVSRLYNQFGKQLVDSGAVSMDRIDEAVRRVLRFKYRLGLFDHPYVDESLEKKELLSKPNLKEARRIAGRSMVLLRNEGGALPLSKDLKDVAVVGPLANSKEDMLGTWIGDGKADDAVTVVQGMRRQFGKRNVSYAQGCEAECTGTGGFGNAVAAAQAAQATVVVLGEPWEWSGEASSRSDIGLPGKQQQLVEQIAATGKPYVVVLMNGRPLTINWLAENAPAVLEAWYPGTQAGLAVTDVLTGKVNPGGKLPVTFPRSTGQIPNPYNQPPTGRPFDEKNKYTSKYLDSPNTPLYPFGYGLSYTTFELANLSVSPSSAGPDGPIEVSADVTNTGSRAGDEVVQLYLRDKVASVVQPVRKLRGFQRVTLKRGETKRVSFTLTREDFSLVNAANQTVVEPGAFDVWVSDSSTGGLQGSFEITG